MQAEDKIIEVVFLIQANNTSNLISRNRFIFKPLGMIKYNTTSMSAEIWLGVRF